PSLPPLCALLAISDRRRAHPGAARLRVAALLQALAVARPVAGDDVAELVPVDGAETPMAGSLVEAQRRIGKGQSQMVALRHRRIDEFLAQLVVGEALDLPADRLVGMLRLLVRWPEHHQARPPPALERVLRHRLLRRRAGAQRQHDLVALALVEALLLADADHRPRVRAVGAAAQRDL